MKTKLKLYDNLKIMIIGSISPPICKNAMAWESKSKFLFDEKAGIGICLHCKGEGVVSA